MNIKNFFSIGNKKPLPIGLQLHNPGNIRHQPPQLWLGQVGHKGGFCRFSSNVFGWRAMWVLLNNYNQKHNLYSIRQIIARWAPPSENDTNAYVRFITKRMDCEPNKNIIFRSDYDELIDDATEMIYAMCLMEQGLAFQSYISKQEIEEGRLLAFHRS